MSEYIKWLEGLNAQDTKVRAVLRRSLAFDPGTFVSAYPYVEPFVISEKNPWRREMHYLVAGLWALHWRKGQSEIPMTIGHACAVHQIASRSSSTENRFIALLDSDSEQLPYRLRQMIALLKEYPIDFETLLIGLLHWNNEYKRIQNAWARDFYRNMNYTIETDTNSLEEQTV